MQRLEKHPFLVTLHNFLKSTWISKLLPFLWWMKLPSTFI